MTNNTNNLLWLGVDIGSITVKVAVVNPVSKQLIYSSYKRHKANQPKVTYDLLADIHQRFPESKFKVAVCGSGGKLIC